MSENLENSMDENKGKTVQRLANEFENLTINPKYKE